MSKKISTIAFKNIRQLWNFAQRINATNIEILTSDMILICNCTEEDLKLLSQYGGKIVTDFVPSNNKRSLNQH